MTDYDVLCRSLRALIEGVPHVIRLFKGVTPGGEVVDGELHVTLPHPDSDPAVRGVIRAALSARALKRVRERVDRIQ